MSQPGIPPNRPGIDLGDGLRFDPPLLLAPMEGVTDRSFRGLILESNPGAVGATCTEFIRVTATPIPTRKLRRELDGVPAGGEPADGGHAARPDPRAGRPAPLGLQLMGNRPDMVAATAVNAAEAGADYIDLNFGCPAPRVYQHRAGSALLDDLPALERLLRAVVDACPRPVTAKIRSGGEDDSRLEELAQRVEQAGARLLTVHARLRIQRYQDPADWRRIERAVAAVSIPVIGNGSADGPRNIEAMFESTGCAGVMVGRGAMADPWVFRRWQTGGEAASRAEVLLWLRTYVVGMEQGGASPVHASGRLKQMLRALDASGLLPLGESLPTLLRLKEAERILAHLDQD